MKEIIHFYKKGVHLSGCIDKDLGEKTPEDITIHLDSSNIKKAFKIVDKYSIKNIKLSPNEYQLDNLDFLKNELFDDLEVFSNGYCSITDYSGLENKTRLKKLMISTEENFALDFAQFKSLEYLSIEWKTMYSSLDKLKNLKWIAIQKFNHDNFKVLSDIRSLKKLEINHGTFKSLAGIEELKDLEEIDIDSAIKLTDLNGISENHSNLLKVRLHGVPNLNDASALSNAKFLKHLQITRFKRLKNLDFINDLNNLETIAIRPVTGKEQLIIKK